MLFQKKAFIGVAVLALVLGVGLLGYKTMAVGNMTDADPSDVLYETFKGESFLDEVVVETEQGSYKHVVEVYPKEVYLGDPIYIASYYESLSDKPISPFRENLWYRTIIMLEGISIKFASDKVDETYSYKPERPRSVWYPSVRAPFPTGVLGPKSLALELFGYCETPPLEDWQGTFWKKLREQMSADGVSCSITLSTHYYVPDPERNSIVCKYRTVVCDLLVKPRPETETELITNWYNSLEQRERDDERKLAMAASKKKVDKYGLENEPCGISDIEIGDKAYNPWHFIRYGNRKPCIPSNPTTVEGWRQLEGSLSPSLMRDEIHLTRLLLEYYSACSAEEAEGTKNEICNWLKSLPRAQRLVLCPSRDINGGRIAFKPDVPLKEKQQELVRAIEEAKVEFEFEREK